jgi:ATP-dependent DNA helicase DinG
VNSERSNENDSNDPNVPNDPNGSNVLAFRVRDAFADEGALARIFTGYEPRDGQRRMALAVADVLERSGTLLAEAGTGTGKTLAYLIPAILSGHRVLVSTGTKNLQEQIYFKDLPALQEALDVPFTATLMKGRGNYLCLHRWEQYKQSFGSFGSFEPFGLAFERSGRERLERSERPERSERLERPERPERSERFIFLPIIDAWARKTETGDKAELRDLPETLPMWSEISAEADSCLGSDCPRYEECFVTRMRQRAAESDVVIVNHHLLCADASVRRSEYGEVIPFCPTLVVDEAHQLEDVATQYFGCGVSATRIEALVRDGERLLSVAMMSAVRARDDLARALTRVADHSRMFFSGLALAGALQSARGQESRVRYSAESIEDHFEDGMALAGALEGLEATLALTPAPLPSDAVGAGTDVASGPEATALVEGFAALQRRAAEVRDDLRFLMRAADPDFVYFVETRGRSVFLRASPIDVSRIVRDVLFDRMRSVVLTSATLAVDGSFEYVKRRLGIREADEIRVASEFDFARQALLYLPKKVPPPKAPTFAAAAAREITEILKRSRGRAFVLFTSYAVMRSVQQVVEMTLPYPLLVQGSAPRTDLIERFRTTPGAVLLATSSFWQGVDVVGDALSCVIIDKLPFASPGDPVTAARIDAINAAGGNAFADYQVPLAILTLQQGLGRLIRHRGDRGVLAVLDPRLRTMGYGRRFLASLPPAPVTQDIEAVGRFFM